ncbi:methyltransferase domain-containing protein [Roseiterribacter gracilis]|uniref:Methyltransferase type 11 n=1 Tax=Roseiterribacter gracilis TaxID=2812848 RepID=A0A8S8XC78_9PROT|nr:methyltransferase type 11 [Rhodospirillales bacterium TMPK1]
MYRDVVDLRRFYESQLGQTTRRIIRRRVRELWPDLRGQRVLGLGYATPYLRQFTNEASHVAAVMPASQGVVFWPGEGPGLAALADEDDLPFADMSFDRVLVVHGFEGAEYRRPMLREIWRVLDAGGRLLVVAANRAGVWARTERTPFGQGSPYSATQLEAMLRDALFVPERSTRALYVPPFRSRMFLAGAGAWENIGRRWFPTFGGVNLVEASKQLYAPTPIRELTRAERKRLAVAPAPRLTQR